jgi:hypothetical protein
LPLASVPSEIRDPSIVLISCEQRTGGTKHPRSFGRGDKVYDPWHYVPVLALVDVAVVYKVDRRTRALADFAKIVEVFDRQGVCFVSVTQQFNTATSMGRLTLNVLSAGPPTRSSGPRRVQATHQDPDRTASAETAAMLFWALLASGQISMRKIDGWRTLASKLLDQPIDLAA